MAATPSVTVSIGRRRIQRDLEVSLGFMAVGIGLLAVLGAMSLFGVLSAGTASTSDRQILAMALGGMGEVFAIIGTLFAGINWTLLRSPRVAQ